MELAQNFRFRWVTSSDKGSLCHQHRCDDPAVANRLCAVHNAYWLAHGRRPAMPEFESGPAPDMIEQLANETREAEREYRRLASLPMRNADDARVVKSELDAARMLAANTRDLKRSSIRPLLNEAVKLRKAHNTLIAKYTDCAKLARMRLEQFEHLHDLELPPLTDTAPPRPSKRPSAPPPKPTKGKGKR